MEAGRELDALIAEKVFGLTVFREGGDTYLSDGNPPPGYSTNIAAAWEVVEHLKIIKPDFWFSLSRDPNGNGWYVENGPDREEMASAQTAPHTICLAALRAIAPDVSSNPEA